jgi:hypothetical protein
MSPKGPCVKGLAPRETLLGDGEIFKRRGLVGGLQVTFTGASVPLPLPLFCFLAIK